MDTIKDIMQKLMRKMLPENASIQDRYRLYTFIYSSILLFIAIPLNLLQISGPQDTYYFYLNLLNLLVSILIFFLFYYKKIKLTTALTSFLIANQLEIACESLYCTFNPSLYHSHLIVGNLVLSSLLILVAIVAYIRYIPFIIAVISIGTYSITTIISGNEIHKNFLAIFAVVFFIIAIMGERLIKAMERLQLENLHLKKEEAEMLRILRINKPQIKAYIEFSKKTESTAEEMEQLLELIGERTQRNIINTVSNYLTEKHSEISIIAQTFPELTRSEHEVAQLIIQGKKLGDICNILNKTENNITAHRGHIRKKLGLKPQDNLKDALIKRLSATQQQQDYPQNKA